MMKKILAKAYLWFLLALLYSPILIIMIFSFTEAKVLGNWTGFSTKLYSSLFSGGMHHSLMSAIWNTFAIAILAATVSTALGSVAAIGIYNMRSRARAVMNFTNNIPIMNPDIITGVSLFLLFVSFGVSQGFTTVVKPCDTPKLTNNKNNDTPVMISGFMIGMLLVKFITARARLRIL